MLIWFLAIESYQAVNYVGGDLENHTGGSETIKNGSGFLRAATQPANVGTLVSVEVVKTS